MEVIRICQVLSALFIEAAEKLYVTCKTEKRAKDDTILCGLIYNNIKEENLHCHLIDAERSFSKILFMINRKTKVLVRIEINEDFLKLCKISCIYHTLL